ncbi:hypothetical protein A2U01_0072341 [Trifolium medium]|uniref:Uncharacterized protein n=1 Tax=Trifolium medium TaxID=97028 RepID=A0A392SRR3_9FABA|nr:hypothetical protein [Trifolium medium]
MLFATPDQRTTRSYLLGNHMARVATKEKTTNTESPEDHLACSRTTFPSLFLVSTIYPSAMPRNSDKVGSSSQNRYKSSRTKTQASGAGTTRPTAT